MIDYNIDLNIQQPERKNTFDDANYEKLIKDWTRFQYTRIEGNRLYC